MKDEKETYKQFSIRVPAKLDELLEEDKKRNRRSKSEQVNFVLEKHYQAELLDDAQNAHLQN